MVDVSTYAIDVSNVPHNPKIEEIVSYLNAKTQNPEKEFFRVIVTYFLCKIASSLRTTIVTKDRGEIPVNAYAIALAASGYSKGHSVAILEDLTEGFRSSMLEIVIPFISEKNLHELAAKRAVLKNTDEQTEFEKVQSEYENGGTIPFTFDSGTVPAIKQLRQVLLMGKIGSINLQIDEISLNLLGSIDVLTAFLELYDKGMIKTKVTKNTAENKRGAELVGCTPTNMLLFGTPVKLFDDQSSETNFNQMLEMGYARRCIFALGSQRTSKLVRTPQEIYQDQISVANVHTFQRWYDYFAKLASVDFYDWKVALEDHEAVLLVQYKCYCEIRADAIPEHMAIEKAEMSHRYFKALKIAGALAFINLESNITEEVLLQSIKLVEESGIAFKQIRTREKSHVRLAKYIIANGKDNPMTQVELMELLPYFRGNANARSEMLTLASQWAYSNHSVITKTVVSNIDMYSGESLKLTDLTKLIISYSGDLADNYQRELVEFDQLTVLANTPDINWCNHAFINDHRSEANVIPEFNLIVLDVDGGFNVDMAHQLLMPYKHMIYTTKRSTPEANRFRVILPISHHLKLNQEDYKEFMASIIKWLPFNVDEQANQRSRKWLSNANCTLYMNNDGEVLNILRFIPRVARDTSSTKQAVTNMDRLETWFNEQIDSLGRNNTLLRYAMALLDSGLTLVEITDSVTKFNNKLMLPLAQQELENTIFKTIAKQFI